MSYLLRRLGFYLLAAWASLTLAFVIPRLMPGDPVTSIFARARGRLAPEAMVALRAALGFTDGPLWQQYLGYLARIVRGDLGTSISHFPASVGSVIGRALGWTLLLGGSAVLLSFALGTVLGIWAAWRRSGWFDSVVAPSLVLIGALPYFWLAMLGLYLFGFTLEWFPLWHAYDDTLTPSLSLPWLASVARHLALPAGTVVLATVGGWLLGMRNTMTAVLTEDFMLFAEARGLSPRRMMLAYAARSALLPNVAGFGMALGFVVSGSLLTEIVFSYPGQGFLLISAVQSLDYPLIQGLFLTITFAVLGANWLCDLVSVWLDPRIRRPS